MLPPQNLAFKENKIMKDGICTSCKSTKVFANQDGFTHSKGFQVNAKNRSVWELQKTNTIDFVCVNCGYFEQYISDKSTLSEIALNWDKVKTIDE